MSYILDDLVKLGINEIVFVVGYLREVIQEYIATEYPGITAHYVLQEVQDGTAGAVKLAQPFIDEEVLVLFVDTLFDADLSLATRMSEEWAGVIWAKEVEDYQRFGVIVTDEHGAMTRIVEKPEEPISKLANIGLYYIRDHKLLFEGIDVALNSEPGPGGEFFLTDAFQHMVDQGSRLYTAPVEGWYDCGKPETLLETNHHLLTVGRGGIDQDAAVESSTVEEPVRMEAGVRVEGSTIGPNVTLERGARVIGSTIRDAIVGPDALIENSTIHDSLVGGNAIVKGFQGRLSVADHTEVDG
jgi:glucose-1-phosphate thymidylyltransferase